jgi:hypothetical protein
MNIVVEQKTMMKYIILDFQFHRFGHNKLDIDLVLTISKNEEIL